MHWVGLILAGLTAVGAMAGLGHVEAFVDTPSLLCVLGGGTGSLIAAHGLGGLRLLVSTRAGQGTASDRAHASRVATTGGYCYLVAGAVGSLIGVVQMLCTLDDPASIGPAMAVALLTVLYGLLSWLLVWIPLARSRAAGPVAAGEPTASPPTSF